MRGAMLAAYKACVLNFTLFFAFKAFDFAWHSPDDKLCLLKAFVIFLQLVEVKDHG
jgi:hypothetical protein